MRTNAKLEDTARYFAVYMARTDKYGHTADGNHPSDRAKKHGYDYCVIAENIAYQYNSLGFTTDALGKDFFEGWKHSPEHRKNMLDPDVVDTAVAISRSEKTGYYYAVQIFGRPKPQAIEFSFANNADTPVEYQIGEKMFQLPPRLIRTHEVCRPSRVVFHWPDTEGAARVVQPANGDRFTVVRDGAGFHLKKD